MKRHPERRLTVSVIVVASLVGCDSVKNRQVVYPNAPFNPAGVEKGAGALKKSPYLDLGRRPEQKTRPNPVDVPMLGP
jgi:hypothetical protein